MLLRHFDSLVLVVKVREKVVVTPVETELKTDALILAGREPEKAALTPAGTELGRVDEILHSVVGKMLGVGIVLEIALAIDLEIGFGGAKRRPVALTTSSPPSCPRDCGKRTPHKMTSRCPCPALRLL